MSDQKKELILRAQAKIKELNSIIAKIKVNAQSSSNEEQEKIKKKISMLEETVKEASENFTESVAKKINDWIK